MNLARKATGRPKKQPLYVLPHGIEVIGEYPAKGQNRYCRLRIRTHPFFPDVPVVSNGIYVRKSRVILASKLGRALTSQEHAHHVDEDKKHDVSDNLEPLSAAEHNKHHKTGSRHKAKSRAQTSATLQRKYASGERIAKPVRGSNQGCAKLTEAQASCIKHSSEKTKLLAEQYGVSTTTIKQIRNGTIWRHVP